MLDPSDPLLDKAHQGLSIMVRAQTWMIHDFDLRWHPKIRADALDAIALKELDKAVRLLNAVIFGYQTIRPYDFETRTISAQSLKGCRIKVAKRKHLAAEGRAKRTQVHRALLVPNPVDLLLPRDQDPIYLAVEEGEMELVHEAVDGQIGQGSEPNPFARQRNLRMNGLQSVRNGDWDSGVVLLFAGAEALSRSLLRALSAEKGLPPTVSAIEKVVPGGLQELLGGRAEDWNRRDAKSPTGQFYRLFELRNSILHRQALIGVPEVTEAIKAAVNWEQHLMRRLNERRSDYPKSSYGLLGKLA